MKQKILALALAGIGIGLAGAARADLASAQTAFETGLCEDAIKALTPAAEGGDPAAQKVLGDVYLDDRRQCTGETGSMKAALAWYEKAARSGNADALRKLVSLYQYARGDQSAVQATYWMARLAALGGADDLAHLADRHERAEGVPHDRVLAYAFNLLASRRLEKDDGGAALTRLERSAKQMSPEQLAEAEKLAAAWKPGAPLPDVSTSGRRDPRDWYVAAAKGGDLEAAHKAGTLYWEGGYGLTPQPEQAAFWLRKAAEGGIADAQYQLSQMYSMGYAVPKDLVLAYALHMLAAKGGDADAIKRQGRWDDALTEEQLGEAGALVAKWKKGDELPQVSRYGKLRKVNYVDNAYGKLEPTPEVRALFKAANEGDEAQFASLLAKTENINDYLVDNEKLLHALLLPAASLRAELNTWREAGNSVRDKAHWQSQQARHAALQPAKTRMLALALERGAVFNEGTRRENAAALHLAAMFGSPEMVRLLLRHGADPRQFGGQSMRQAPLEFALDQKENGQDLPELITPEQRTANFLVLLQAGAPRPYIRADIDASRKKDSQEQLKRPVADYLLWSNLVALTRGSAVLDALQKTGTSPAEDDEGKTCFDYAAEAGNAEAIAWLKTRVPRFGKDHRDRWLDAAMYAMYSSAPGRDKVLQALLARDMKWSQQGPAEEHYSREHHTLFGSREAIERGTLLNHATRAGRAEWIPKLAALGMPVDKGGSTRDLVAAVSENNIEGVKALLAQGADPLDRLESSLSLALKAPVVNDAMLDVLLNHIVHVQKRSLAELRPAPLDDVLARSDEPSMPRVRKLLAAGASPQGLSGTAIDAAFSARDRSLVPLLIKHGLLGKVSAKEEDEKETYFLFFAIRAGRTDLLPAILASGEDPNHQNKMHDGSPRPSAVEYAISQGNLAVLKALLAHGGKIDTTTPQPWGTALDRAVLSLDAAMLRKVSKDFSLPLTQVCLPSTNQLAKVVLEAPAAYWTLLQEHGFATGRACAGIQERLALHLSETPGVLLEGWLGQQLVQRLQLLGSGREDFSADTWAAIDAGKNEPLAGLLASAGWKAPASTVAGPEAEPQRDKAADLALQASLPGHYYLSGMREMGAEILLRPNGKFQYSMSYGAVDQFSQGSWKVWNQQVVFHSESDSAQSGSIRQSADTPPAKLPAGQLAVDVRYRGKSIPDVKVAVLGDAPLKAEGRTGASGWRTDFRGPVRHIAVSHEEVAGGKWLALALEGADVQRNNYRLDLNPPAPEGEAFDYTLDVRDGALVLDRGGRAMSFEKH